MDRLKEAFVKFMDSYRPLDYYGYYQCSLVKWDKANQTGDVKPDDPRLPKDGMTGLPFRSGVPGITVDFSGMAGVRCMVGFESGNPSKAYIHGWLDCTPSEITISGSSKVIVKSASVYLAEENAEHPISFGDVTQKLIQGVMDLLKTMAPQGVCLGIPVPVAFATDVAGANSYGAGGAVAVTTLMITDVATMNSLKSKTG